MNIYGNINYYDERCGEDRTICDRKLKTWLIVEAYKDLMHIDPYSIKEVESIKSLPSFNKDSYSYCKEMIYTLDNMSSLEDLTGHEVCIFKAWDYAQNYILKKD